MFIIRGCILKHYLRYIMKGSGWSSKCQWMAIRIGHRLWGAIHWPLPGSEGRKKPPSLARVLKKPGEETCPDIRCLISFLKWRVQHLSSYHNPGVYGLSSVICYLVSK